MENRILIVDDTKMILQMAKKIIESNLNNVGVEIESDPLRGKERMSENKYQIIILDIIMPKITGIELLQWIKKQDHLKGAKVIMFTSLNDSSALVESFELGAYDFITKPLESNEFIARINHAIVEYNQEALIREGFQEITKKNDELKELNEKLKITQADLVQSERLASVGNLAAGMAHEINNPLGFIKSNFLTLKENVNELLQMYMESKRYVTAYSESEQIEKKYLDLEKKHDYSFISEDIEDIFLDIEHGTERIEGIIKSLRNFSEIDSDGKKEYVYFEDILNNIRSMTSLKFQGNIRLVTKNQTNAMLYCNKGDYNLSVLGLLDNALEAIEKKGSLFAGEIRMEASEHDEKIEIKIIDNGVGMSEQVKKYALNPFYTTKEVGDGSGLGLTMAYNFFVNDLKGTMNILSEEKAGTEIRIIIPIKK